MKRYALIAILAALGSACGKKPVPQSPAAQPKVEDPRAQYVGNWGRLSDAGDQFDDLVEITSEYKVFRHLSPENFSSVMSINLRKLENKDQRAQMATLFNNIKKSWTVEVATLQVEGEDVGLKVASVSVKFGAVEMVGKIGEQIPCVTAWANDEATKEKSRARYCKLSDEVYADVLMDVILLKRAQMQKAIATGHEIGSSVLDSVSKITKNVFLNLTDAASDSTSVAPAGPVVTSICAEDMIQLVSSLPSPGVSNDPHVTIVPNGSAEGFVVRVVTGPNSISECVIPLQAQ